MKACLSAHLPWLLFGVLRCCRGSLLWTVKVGVAQVPSFLPTSCSCVECVPVMWRGLLINERCARLDLSKGGEGQGHACMIAPACLFVELHLGSLAAGTSLKENKTAVPWSTESQTTVVAVGFKSQLGGMASKHVHCSLTQIILAPRPQTQQHSTSLQITICSVLI